MALDVPQEVEQQQLRLTGLGAQARASPDHLAVQRAHLGRPQHHHAVHARAVPALGEQHRVAEHGAAAGRVEGRERLGAVGALAVDLHRAEALGLQDPAELLRRLDEREEDHRLALRTPSRQHLVGDALQVRVERRAEVAGRVVARLRAHCGQVDGQRHRLRLDGAEVALLDGARKRVLVGDRVEVGAQVPAVSPVGRGGHAEHVGGVEMVEHRLVAGGQRVVRLVNDDRVEPVPREPIEARRPHHRLHAADGHAEPLADARALGLLHAAAEARRLADLVGRLVEQLAPVGEDEHAPAPVHHVLGHHREHDGLAAPGGEDEKRLGAPLVPLALYRPARLLLVRPQIDRAHHIS